MAWKTASVLKPRLLKDCKGWFSWASCASCMVGLMLTMGSTWAWAQYDLRAWSGVKTWPTLSAQDLNGKDWNSAGELSRLGRPLLVNFWATWCEPCKEELPSLQTLAQLEGREHLEVLTINVAESKTVVQRFVQKTDLQLPVIMDSERRWAKALGIHVYPSTLLVDSTGQIRFMVRGALDWTQPEVQTWFKALQEAAAQRKTK